MLRINVKKLVIIWISTDFTIFLRYIITFVCLWYVFCNLILFRAFVFLYFALVQIHMSLLRCNNFQYLIIIRVYVDLLWKVYNCVSEYDISSCISDIHLLTCLHFPSASYYQYAQYVFFKIYVFHIMKATYVNGKNKIIFWYLHISFFNVLEDYTAKILGD